MFGRGCRHGGVDLADGGIVDHGTVTCPNHAYVFDLATGECIVPGGGVTRLRDRKAVEKRELEGDEQMGCDILSRALSAPLSQLADNCGLTGPVIVEQVLAGKPANLGLNAVSLELEGRGRVIEGRTDNPERLAWSTFTNQAANRLMRELDEREDRRLQDERRIAQERERARIDAEYERAHAELVARGLLEGTQ